MRLAPFALALLAAPALALALTGCETTAQKSARLEKAALARARTSPQSTSGATVTSPSKTLRVLSATLVRGSEGFAAVVSVRNTSAKAQLGAPISIAVHGPSGSSLYTNGEGGLARSLTTLPMVPAHGEVTWVDDQVQASGTPSGVSAKVGEGIAVAKAPPAPQASSRPPVREAGGGESIAGEVVNRTGVEQRELVVFATARRGGHIVGAGRAVLATFAAGATSPFQIFLIGTAKGAQIVLDAPASTARSTAP